MKVDLLQVLILFGLTLNGNDARLLGGLSLGYRYPQQRFLAKARWLQPADRLDLGTQPLSTFGFKMRLYYPITQVDVGHLHVDRLEFQSSRGTPLTLTFQNVGDPCSSLRWIDGFRISLWCPKIKISLGSQMDFSAYRVNWRETPFTVRVYLDNTWSFMLNQPNGDPYFAYFHPPPALRTVRQNTVTSGGAAPNQARSRSESNTRGLDRNPAASDSANQVQRTRAPEAPLVSSSTRVEREIRSPAMQEIMLTIQTHRSRLHRNPTTSDNQFYYTKLIEKYPEMTAEEKATVKKFLSENRETSEPMKTGIVREEKKVATTVKPISTEIEEMEEKTDEKVDKDLASIMAESAEEEKFENLILQAQEVSILEHQAPLIEKQKELMRRKEELDATEKRFKNIAPPTTLSEESNYQQFKKELAIDQAQMKSTLKENEYKIKQLQAELEKIQAELAERSRAYEGIFHSTENEQVSHFTARSQREGWNANQASQQTPVAKPFSRHDEISNTDTEQVAAVASPVIVPVQIAQEASPGILKRARRTLQRHQQQPKKLDHLEKIDETEVVGAHPARDQEIREAESTPPPSALAQEETAETVPQLSTETKKKAKSKSYPFFGRPKNQANEIGEGQEVVPGSPRVHEVDHAPATSQPSLAFRAFQKIREAL